MREQTGCDAVMIGRGAMGNPWLFRSLAAVTSGLPDPGVPTPVERAAAFERHVQLIVELCDNPRREVVELRKACVWYAKGLFGANALRQSVWACDDKEQLLAVARSFFASLRVGRALTPTAREEYMDRGASP
jgi:tRNA-dihydrouridine synthase